MMKKALLKRVVQTICSVCLISSFVLTGCDGGGKNSSDSSKGVEIVKFCDLITNGKSDYKIVYNENGAAAEYTAASELQNYLKQATGVKLPLTEQSEISPSLDGKYISVGNTSLWKLTGIEANKKELNGDGFYIRTMGNSILVNGATARSVLYGVYQFLEDNAGVRFFADDCTYVPHLDILSVNQTQQTEIPDFDTRAYLSGVIYDSNEDFAAKLRFEHEYLDTSDVYGGNNGWYQNTSHTSLSYVPTSVYYTEANKEENAHMYSIDGGTVYDICYTDGITEDGKLDESMETSAAKVAVESLKQFILSSDENTDFFMFGQEDNQEVCNCDRCKKAVEKYKRSGILIRFVNVLSDEIGKWMKEEKITRDVKIVTFAYQYTETAPVTKDGGGKVQLLDPTCKPRDNVYIRLATIGASRYYSFDDPKQTVSYQQLFKEWSAIHNHFMVWTYHTSYKHAFWYMPTINTWHDNLRLYKEMGVSYVLMQSTHYEYNSWQALMETYLASKALWNKDADLVTARKEYIDCYYGSVAAPYITTFIERFDRYYQNMMNEYSPMFINPDSAEWYDIRFLESQLELMKDAEKSVEASDLTEEEKNTFILRIRRVSLTPRYMILYNYGSYYSSGVYDFAKEFFDICDELGVRKYAEFGSLTSLKTNYGIV